MLPPDAVTHPSMDGGGFWTRAPAAGWLALLVATAAGGRLESQEVTLLQPGVAVERAVGGGESHHYGLELRAGQTLRITVEQLGIDVEVEVRGPQESRLAAFDTPNGRHGAEVLVATAAETGTHGVEIRPLASWTSGRYRVVAEALAATPSSDPRLAAERAATRAAELAREGSSQSRHDALAEYRRALLYFEQEGAALEQADILFAVGRLHRQLGKLDQASAALERSLPLWQTVGDRHGEARARNDLGFVAWRGAQNRRARLELERALSLRSQLGDVWGQAQTLNNIGLTHHSAGELGPARERYGEALELCRKVGDPSLEATLLDNIGNVHRVLGEPHLALENSERALALYRQTDQPAAAARALSNAGVAHRALGEHQRALERYQEALGVFRQQQDRRSEAILLSNIGLLYLALGEPDRARSYLERALLSHRRLEDRRGQATTLNNLGLTWERLDVARRAEAYYRKALVLRRELEDRRGEAITLDHLATLHAERQEHAEAAAGFARALQLSRAVGDLRIEARVLHGVAKLDLENGDLGASVERLERALDLQRSAHDREGEAETLYSLALARRRGGRPLDAMSRLEACIEIIESLRLEVADAQLRASFFSIKRRAYDSYVDLLMELDREQPGSGLAARALEATEKARARALLDLLAESMGEIRSGIDPQLQERERVLQQRLSAKAARLTRLGRDPDRREERRALEHELDDLANDIEAVEAELRRHSPRYAGLSRPRPLRLPEIEGLLDARSLLLYYHLGAARSFLWLVGSSETVSFELPPGPELESDARRLHVLWSTLDVGARASELEAATGISRKLLGPVADRLAGQRLVVVPDGALHYLPFAALPHPGAEDGAYRPLLVDHEVVTLPSASVLDQLRRTVAGRPKAEHSLAVIADPIFSPDDPRTVSGAAAGPPASGSPPPESVSPTSSLQSFHRLAASREEAQALAGLAGDDGLLLALDAEASRELVIGGRLGDYRILHFATHGVLDAERPILSGLALSMVDGAGRPVDGFLRLHDVFRLRLGAELVVLSGCETALGKELRGEGLVGLTRGFMYAGAPGVVASLWQVEDRASAELMRRFYGALLREGERPAAALRSAQLDLWRQSRYRDPYYWAVFILQGDWSQPVSGH